MKAAVVGLILAFSVFAGIRPCMAQSSTGRVSRLIVGKASGISGGAVPIPMILTPTPGTRLRFIRLTLRFNSTYLKLEGLSRGRSNSAELVDVRIQSQEIETQGKVEFSTVTITATLRGSAAPAIPGGPLGELTFRISEHTDSRTVTLEPEVRGLVVGSSAFLPPEALVADAGSVSLDPPTSMMGVTCFFFTH